MNREQFATVAEHIAAWKRGGRRWARVEGFNVDAVQAEEQAERDALARADAVETVMAADPVMAVSCGAPVEVPRGSDGLTDAERTAEWQRLSAIEELRAANIALMARLERVGAVALGHDDGACPTCGAARGDR